MKKEIILWGGTGQSKVVRPIVEYYGSKVIAIIDDTPDLKSPFRDVPIYVGKDGFFDFIKKREKEEIGFIVAIGNDKTGRHSIARRKISRFLKDEGLFPESVIHPNAYISQNVQLGEGVQVMANATIIPETKIGDYCIINTCASVDHECILEDGVEIAPQATLCGCVYIGENSWIGANAVILPKLKIGKNCVIGAGSVVTKNIPDDTMAFGNPAKFIKKTEY